MFPRILKRLRELVRTKQYVMTLHAEEEMDEDGLSIFDIENCLLSGEIVERQKDQATAEWKYLVHGGTLGENEQIVVVTKLEQEVLVSSVRSVRRPQSQNPLRHSQLREGCHSAGDRERPRRQLP